MNVGTRLERTGRPRSVSADDQDRILDKLDDIVDSPWRDPPDYGEPLANTPYKKIRIGEFRLSVSVQQTDQRLIVARIKRRSDADTADDDYPSHPQREMLPLRHPLCCVSTWPIS